MRNDMSTKKATKKPEPDEMRAEYDPRGGVRGKFFAEYQKGTNLILLAPDVAKSFPDSEAVNEALRKVISENRVAAKGAKRRSG
jgi:hypothetical protein